MNNHHPVKFNEIPPVHELINAAIETVPRAVPLYEIAQRCGLSRPNSKVNSPAISMLRNGTMRLPLDKVVPVANELNLDPTKLLISVIRESVRSITVKGKTEEEIKASEKVFEKAWSELSQLLAMVHTEKEEAAVQAFREAEKEVGHEIVMTPEVSEKIKNLLVEEYSL